MNGVHTTDPISTSNDNEYETLQNNHRIDDSTNGHAAMLAGFGPSPPRLPSSPVDSETTDYAHMEQAFDNLSNDDQTYILSVYQEDIFINE